MSTNPYKTLSSKPDYETPYFKVRKDSIIHPDGKEGTYYVIEFKPAVFSVALTAQQEVYLVGLYRYTTEMYSWEVPAGSSEGQDLLEAAKRELQEETGIVSDTWKEIGKVQVSNGNCKKFAHIFLATDVTETPDHHKAEEGINKMIKVPFKKAFEMIKNGEITDADSIAALTQAALHLHIL